MDSPDPVACALFLVLSFVVAGIPHTLWLASPFSERLAVPVDFGGSFRGKRIFGEHKTLRGFVVMVPAAALAFAFTHRLPVLEPGLWRLSSLEYASLGAFAGFGFMLGELPNSFFKRRLGIPPGEAPARGFSRALVLTFDRLDSILGMLVVVSSVVPTALQTWALVLLIGPLLHVLFSGALFLLRVKRRWA